MYDIYLDNMLLPIAPSKITTKVKNQNQTMNLINEGEINILKQAGLTEISFECIVPNANYSFVKNFTGTKNFLEKLESLKQSKEPFQFIISRTGLSDFGTNLKVALEDYSVIEDYKNVNDIVVQIKLKQYRAYGTKTFTIEEEVIKKANQPRETKNSPMPEKSTEYTVVAGDSLWKIAKLFYGDGSKWKMIYEANKDIVTNPNLIYPNQKLTIPASDKVIIGTPSYSNTSSTSTTTNNSTKNETFKPITTKDTSYLKVNKFPPMGLSVLYNPNLKGVHGGGGGSFKKSGSGGGKF